MSTLFLSRTQPFYDKIKFYMIKMIPYNKQKSFTIIDIAADQELPDDQPYTPIWIEPPNGATQVEMLERVETMVRKYQDVMVQYLYSNEPAAAWCEERGWEYCDANHIYNCKPQCVVLLKCRLDTEFLTRGRNMSIIVTNW